MVAASNSLPLQRYPIAHRPPIPHGSQQRVARRVPRVLVEPEEVRGHPVGEPRTPSRPDSERSRRIPRIPTGQSLLEPAPSRPRSGWPATPLLDADHQGVRLREFLHATRPRPPHPKNDQIVHRPQSYGESIVPPSSREARRRRREGGRCRRGGGRRQRGGGRCRRGRGRRQRGGGRRRREGGRHRRGGGRRRRQATQRTLGSGSYFTVRVCR